MNYKVTVCIIDSNTYKAKRQSLVLSTDNKSPDYLDMVIAFFRQWDNPNKYTNADAIGIESMELIE